MSDMSITQIKCQMLNLLAQAKAYADIIHNEINNLPKCSSSIIVTEIDFETNSAIKLQGITQSIAISIFGNFTYKIDQDSKEAYRRPGVVQCSLEHGAGLKNALDSYNRIKNDIKHFHISLQERMSLEDVKAIWQSVCSMLSLKQLFRHAHYYEGNIVYAGISVVTKPVVKRVTKEQIIKTIDTQLEKLPLGVDPVQYVDLLEEKKNEINALSETDYSFRMARRGAPRPVVNLKTELGKTKQVMASMPVVVFTENMVNVTLPRPKKQRNRRSDAFLHLAEEGSHMQLNISPRHHL
tara:strand:- start:7 stop:891 length:885 start_codon:yes stop_codon:yes gene_type:complete